MAKLKVANKKRSFSLIYHMTGSVNPQLLHLTFVTVGVNVVTVVSHHSHVLQFCQPSNFE